MSSKSPPQFPIYIPSKGRSESRLTMKWFEKVGCPYNVVVEEEDHDDYVASLDPDLARVIILDPKYQDEYDTCDPGSREAGKLVGAGAARNFAWEHSMSEGHDWHWVIDDNIRGFYRLNRNRKIPFRDAVVFRMMEDFVLRYTNVAMAGPNYYMFAPRKQKFPPFATNTRIYSCNLIRNDIPFRWRGRLNEDTILSLDILKGGWATIQFYTFLAKKMVTQVVKGGYTEQYLDEGTKAKTQILVNAHPDVTELVWKFSRWHHEVDYSQFQFTKLVKRDDLEIRPGNDSYGMRLRDYGKTRSEADSAQS